MSEYNAEAKEQLEAQCALEDQIAQLQCDVRAGRVSDMVAAFKYTLLTQKLRALSKQEGP